MHLLLVTQNFENQLPSQIAANAGLRICFRVQDAAATARPCSTRSEAASHPQGADRAGVPALARRVERSPSSRRRGWPARVPGKEVVASRGDRPGSCRSPRWRTRLPEPPIVDVPAADTDMYSVVEGHPDVLRQLAAGGRRPVPCPGPRICLGISASAPSQNVTDLVWPVGMLGRARKGRRQSPIGLEAYGPHTLFVGGAGSTNRARCCGRSIDQRG